MVSVAARPIEPSPAERQRVDRRPALLAYALLGLMMLAYALLFGWLSASRYDAYETHALDLGNMAQAAWNTVHGHPFSFTNVRLMYDFEAWNTNTRLSFHVEALFPFISLVYLVYPHPESLLILQTVALALGAIPTFWLARDVLGHAWCGLVFAAIYLLFPSLEALNLFEFHPVSLATPLLILAFWFAWRRQYVPFGICALAAMGGKEEIGLVVAMFGLYIAVVQRERRAGALAILVGVGWSLFATIIVEKHFRQPGTITFARSRYGYLGHGISGALHTVLHRPSIFFHVIFTRAKLSYLTYLLEPVGFLAVLAPLVLLLAAPTVMINVLSTDQHMYSGVGDNSAEVISVVVITAILGTGWLCRRLRRWLPARAALLLVTGYGLLAALLNQHVNGYTPLGANYHVPTIGEHQHLANRFVSMVPPEVPVSTQDQLDPHLSSRRYLYLFEDLGDYLNYPRAHYLLLDASAPTFPLPSWQIHDDAMKLLGKGWGVQAAQDGLILFRRSAPNTHIPAAFYSFATARPTDVPHALHGSFGGLSVLGYGAQKVDQPNYRVPNLAYSIYLRPQRRLAQDLQPVIFQLTNGHMVNCTSDPLGLAWYPTSEWAAGKTFVVRMRVLEFLDQYPGQANLVMGLFPMPHHQYPAHCDVLWSQHGSLWSVGSQDVSF